ncbi:MAG: hypothetical protein LBB53_00305 [Prevotellaceae bacterium]|jgi:hypothetical protein|nr:hypothetical protein [Prevotellaceae bacterium]
MYIKKGKFYTDEGVIEAPEAGNAEQIACLKRYEAAYGQRVNFNISTDIGGFDDDEIEVECTFTCSLCGNKISETVCTIDSFDADNYENISEYHKIYDWEYYWEDYWEDFSEITCRKCGQNYHFDYDEEKYKVILLCKN